MYVVLQEIEAIEEQWRSESAELVSAVGRLQDENKRLRRTINPPADGKNNYFILQDDMHAIGIARLQWATQNK